MATNRFERLSPGVYRDLKSGKTVTPPKGRAPEEASIGGGTPKKPPQKGPPLHYPNKNRPPEFRE